jgi:hypothetical protein
MQAVNSFFASDDMKNFRDFYGETKSLMADDLSPGHAANRQAVINEAVDIFAGAEFLGRDMSIEKALEMAHLKIAAPYLPQVVRRDIMAKAKKRSKGLTLKPSSSKTSAPKGKGEKPTGEQLVVNTQERLDKLDF